jgi:hypothetical protein
MVPNSHGKDILIDLHNGFSTLDIQTQTGESSQRLVEFMTEIRN